MSAYDNFYRAAMEQLRMVFESQRGAIETAAGWLGQALAEDHWLYAFGTGHSHLVAEEIFYRAGGLARAVPILDTKLMLHEEAIAATYLERKESYAASIAGHYPLARGDLLVVVSNSGRNAVPIEMAQLGKERGLKVVVITNVKHSRAWPSRHSSGKKLTDVGDLVIDTCGVPGDAVLEMEGLPGKVGSVSTLAGILIIQLLIVEGIEKALRLGKPPEIYISSNSTGDDHNERLLAKYKERIRHL